MSRGLALRLGLLKEVPCFFAPGRHRRPHLRPTGGADAAPGHVERRTSSTATPGGVEEEEEMEAVWTTHHGVCGEGGRRRRRTVAQIGAS
jgi:hypothetical protein